MNKLDYFKNAFAKYIETAYSFMLKYSEITMWAMMLSVSRASKDSYSLLERRNQNASQQYYFLV